MNVQNQAVVLEEEYEVRRERSRALIGHRDAGIVCVRAEINTLDCNWPLERV